MRSSTKNLGSAGDKSAAAAKVFEREGEERESGYYEIGDMLAPSWFIESIAQGDPLMLGYRKVNGY